MTKFKDIIFEKNVAIHCPEEWMSEVLLEYADRKTNIFWKRFSYLGCWSEYKNNTVYLISRGTYTHISYARKNNYKILHYNDVVIKEENKMETKLDYELWIKGRKAKIGSEFFYKGETEAIIESIEIDSEGWAIIFIANSSLEGIIENEIEETFFWEKPIIYQLPDTEGNLSEVKVGQEVWNNELCEWGKITRLCNGVIDIKYTSGLKLPYSFNEINNLKCHPFTTNKPHRDFSDCMDWSHAPKERRTSHEWWEERLNQLDYDHNLEEREDEDG